MRYETKVKRRLKLLLFTPPTLRCTMSLMRTKIDHCVHSGYRKGHCCVCSDEQGYVNSVSATDYGIVMCKTTSVVAKATSFRNLQESL